MHDHTSFSSGTPRGVRAARASLASRTFPIPWLALHLLACSSPGHSGSTPGEDASTARARDDGDSDATPTKMTDASRPIDAAKPQVRVRDDAAISAPAAAALDPNIDFKWPESLPGKGTCQPGTYTGQFECDYTSPNEFMPGELPLSGPVMLKLEKSANGEFLEIADGTLGGVAAGILGFHTNLSGRLNCAELTFQAEAVDGEFGVGDPPLPFGMVTGSLTGTLDTQTLTLSGEWTLMEDVQGGSCTGPWMASFTP